MPVVSDPGELAPTRLSLLERLRDLDDHNSWQEFFDTYWKLIYCAAIKAGLSDADAEDVVQETIIGISRNMENFRYEPEICSFKGWLMRVTRNRIIDHLRKARSPKHAFVPLASDTSTGDVAEIAAAADGKDFENLWDEEWRKNLLDAAMERVKRKIAPEHYQIFYLQTVKGMSARDVGELLCASIAKVYVVRHRVSRLIKREVKTLERKGLKK
ncbi:MAG TPA: sigma-70 family RNA polymerase sigma factor [Verrucomicrobiae bacterium]|nr:sigma-70 family RNA polymerase sigma factor [Verrucomicrobiae bacterium]